MTNPEFKWTPRGRSEYGLWVNGREAGLAGLVSAAVRVQTSYIPIDPGGITFADNMRAVEKWWRDAAATVKEMGL